MTSPDWNALRNEFPTLARWCYLGRACLDRQRAHARRRGRDEPLKEKHRIIVNVKDNAVRLSMSFLNNEEDVEKAVGAIASELDRKAA